MVRADPTIKIPQVLNGALAASVYICGAQALGPLAVDSGLRPWRFDPFAGWAAITIFIWTTKNFVDDFRAFSGTRDNGFNLGFTVFFSAAAYAMLAWAAASLKSGIAAIELIACYFGVLFCWSLCSWMRRRSTAISDLEKKRVNLRKRWMGYYLFSMTLSAVIALTNNIIVLFFYGAAIWLIFVFDIFHSETFKVNRIEAA